MGIDSKESFAQLHEDSKMKDGIGGLDGVIEHPNKKSNHAKNRKLGWLGHALQMP